MKTKKCIPFLILICFLFSSCDNAQLDENNTNEAISTFTAEDNDFTYEANNVQLFDVDDNGTLCYLWQDLEKSTNMLTTKDLNGKVISTITMESLDFVSAMTFENNIVYYTPDLYEDKSVIYSLDLNTGEKVEICIIEKYKDIKYLTVINDTIYFIGIDEALSDKYYELYKHTDDFTYNGESIKSYNLKNNQFSDISIEYPIAFTKTVYGNIMINAYDENAGYYFQEYILNSKDFGDKVYNNSLKILSNFSVSDNSQQIIYNENSQIKNSNLSENNSSIELVDDVKYVLANGNVYKSGYLFYVTNNGIRRVLLNELLRSEIVLNMAYTHAMPNGYFPEDCGFNINRIEVDYNDFALSILAGDSNFDIYFINTRDSFADNISKKGAFYPLTEIPNANDFINNIFPYVKKEAIDENGDIWMIPTRLSTGTIRYNEKIWERNNLDINSINNLEDMIEFTIRLNNEKVDETYWLFGYTVAEKYFYQLINKYNGYNIDGFKKMAEYFYSKVNYIKNAVIPNSAFVVYNETTKNDLDSKYGYLLQEGYGDAAYSYITDVVKNEDYYDIEQESEKLNFSSHNYVYNRNMATPNIDGVDKNDITCEFVCVNPNSKNLDFVLEYISELCKEKLNQRNTFILQDKSTYDDRVYINDYYDIYNSDSYIRFGLSGELFYEDFVKYLGDEITLDEYLNRIEYKIDAYLNE